MISRHNAVPLSGPTRPARFNHASGKFLPWRRGALTPRDSATVVAPAIDTLSRTDVVEIVGGSMLAKQPRGGRELARSHGRTTEFTANPSRDRSATAGLQLRSTCGRRSRLCGLTLGHAFAFGFRLRHGFGGLIVSVATTARATRGAIALSFLLGLRSLAAEAVEIVTVPFSVGGVGISIEMPRRWVAAPFPIREVPKNLDQILTSSGSYAVWIKEWNWPGTFFRGPLGRMHSDAWINQGANSDANQPDATGASGGRGFLVPGNLLAYVQRTTSNSVFSSYYQFSIARRAGVFWVRLTRSDKKLDEIPSIESWYLGVSENTYVCFDFASVRIREGEPGDKWLAAALYWQHRMIASLQVTGLQQYPSGKETITDWKFPEALKPDPEFLK